MTTIERLNKVSELLEAGRPEGRDPQRILHAMELNLDSINSLVALLKGFNLETAPVDEDSTDALLAVNAGIISASILLGKARKIAQGVAAGSVEAQKNSIRELRSTLTKLGFKLK